MALIDYKVIITPQKPALNFSVVNATASSITVQFDGVQPFSLNLKPNNTVTHLLEPVAGVIKSKMEDAILGVIGGFKGTTVPLVIDPPLGYTIDVAGVTVKLSLSTLALSTYNGMLMATGEVHVG